MILLRFFFLNQNLKFKIPLLKPNLVRDATSLDIESLKLDFSYHTNQIRHSQKIIRTKFLRSSFVIDDDKVVATFLK